MGCCFRLWVGGWVGDGGKEEKGQQARPRVLETRGDKDRPHSNPFTYKGKWVAGAKQQYPLSHSMHSSTVPISHRAAVGMGKSEVGLASEPRGQLVELQGRQPNTHEARSEREGGHSYPHSYCTQLLPCLGDLLSPASHAFVCGLSTHDPEGQQVHEHQASKAQMHHPSAPRDTADLWWWVGREGGDSSSFLSPPPALLSQPHPPTHVPRASSGKHEN